MIEISKELLSAVLYAEIIDVEKDLRGDCLRYCWNDRAMAITQEINIYKLAYKCKEWIINNGYVLKICYVLESNTRNLAFIETTLLKSNQYLSDYYDIDNKTEIEAVIKACEWILKKIK